MKRTPFVVVFMLFLAVLPPLALHAQEPPPSAEEVTPDPWPKTASIGGVTYTLYQPQLDSWDGYLLSAHAAVSVQPAGAAEPVFGMLAFTAYTLVDRVGRTVHLQDFAVQKLLFPSAPEYTGQYQAGFLAMAPPQGRTIALDRLEAMLAAEGAQKKARAVQVRNDPPKFVFTQAPAILIPIDGDPVWRPVQGTSLSRVINSRALVLTDSKTGSYYIHLFDGFVTATSPAGPWTVARSVPSAATKVAEQLARQKIVDLMEGQPDENTKEVPSLKKGAPQVIVTTAPTELIVTRGAPDWVPIQGTMLLYASNTTGNLFRNLNDQMTYVLVTGRWFRASDPAGPWQYVAGRDLPPDFANIPDDSPKENVKASVPGTPQAQEAVIAAETPQTATVYRDKVTFTPQYNGAPELKPVPDTPLMYVVNSPFPVIMVSANSWYAAQNGVWFTAQAAGGPWTVATSVPAVIYSIPPSSPIYYVTYVKVYAATPKYVVVSYTPGYMGTVVTSDGVVVYGTGYVYQPYIAATVWYPPPVTYGYAANVTFTPWTGWAVGFGMGWAMGASYACAPAPYWGAMPYAYGYHGAAAAWGPGGWAATSGNVYQHWGTTSAVSRSSAGYNAWTGNAWSSKVGTSYNSNTGRISAGQQASVSNVYTGNYASGQRGATYNPTTGTSARGGSATYGNAYTGAQGSAKWGQVTGPGGQTHGAAEVNNSYYADHNGNVYKYNPQTQSAQKYENGSWNNVSKEQTPQSVHSQQAAKSAGDSRSAGASWGSSKWGGGFSRSSGAAGGESAARSSGGLGHEGGGGREGGGWGHEGGGREGGGGRSWGGGSFGGSHGGGRGRR